jgi:hypothetical protein
VLPGLASRMTHYGSASFCYYPAFGHGAPRNKIDRVSDSLTAKETRLSWSRKGRTIRGMCTHCRTCDDLRAAYRSAIDLYATTENVSTMVDTPTDEQCDANWRHSSDNVAPKVAKE